MLFLIIAAIMAKSVNGRQRYPWEPTPEELKNLPSYCVMRYTYEWGGTGGKEEKKKYGPVFGQAWGHLHHYCAGLNSMVRAERTVDGEVKRKNYVDAIHSFDYMLDHISDKTTVILPELYFLKGRALEGIGKLGDAAAQYIKAITAKPDYVQAYANLARLHMKVKQNAEARKILKEGLKQVPNAPSLNRLLRQLGDG